MGRYGSAVRVVIFFGGSLGLLGLAPVAHGAAVQKILSGDVFNCALFDDGSLKCWGDNSTGQLGQGDTTNRGDQPGAMGSALPTVILSTKATVKDFVTGSTHACAILSDQTVKCWGNNGAGQLGLGDAVTRGSQPNQMGDALPAVNLGTGRHALQLAAAANTTCALLDDHSVRCWGDNTSGAVGSGIAISPGSAANQMGDALVAVSLGTARTASQIFGGGDFFCALLDNKGLKCWGGNESGQLGQGDTTNRGTQAGQLGDALLELDLGEGRTVASLSLGGDFACAILDDGTPRCWGDNSQGELGLGDTNNRGAAAGQMGAALTTVGLEPGLLASQISCGGNTCCAVFSIPGTLKCWGANSAGQLGLGDTNNRGDAVGEMGVALPFVDFGLFQRVTAVTMGLQHACAFMGDGSVRCWGSNDSGELGLGDTNYRGDQPRTMGTALAPVVLQ